jgi:hypothetical protein
MLSGASSHLEDLNRSIDVSLNNSPSILPTIAAVGSYRGDASMNQPQSVSSLNIAPIANAVPDPMGSSVPPSGLGLNQPTAKSTDTRFTKFKGSCMHCCGEHHFDVCQTREP